MIVHMYSGRDRGNESLNDGVNLRLPSGSRLGWGNIDFDVNLIVSDGATDRDGQYFFDIFTSDGFVGDLPLVNFAAQVSLPVDQRQHVPLYQVGVGGFVGPCRAVQVHRQRRKLCRQSHLPDGTRRARQRRAV